MIARLSRPGRRRCRIATLEEEEEVSLVGGQDLAPGQLFPEHALFSFPSQPRAEASGHAEVGDLDLVEQAPGAGHEQREEADDPESARPPGHAAVEGQSEAQDREERAAGEREALARAYRSGHTARAAVSRADSRRSA